MLKHSNSTQNWKVLWKLKTNCGTGNTGSEGHKCDGIDSIFEVDEAAKMSGNIADECGTGANEYKRYDERNVSVCHSWNWNGNIC